MKTPFNLLLSSRVRNGFFACVCCLGLLMAGCGPGRNALPTSHRLEWTHSVPVAIAVPCDTLRDFLPGVHVADSVLRTLAAADTLLGLAFHQTDSGLAVTATTRPAWLHDTLQVRESIQLPPLTARQSRIEARAERRAQHFETDSLQKARKHEERMEKAANHLPRDTLLGSVYKDVGGALLLLALVIALLLFVKHKSES